MSCAIVYIHMPGVRHILRAIVGSGLDVCVYIFCVTCHPVAYSPLLSLGADDDDNRIGR